MPGSIAAHGPFRTGAGQSNVGRTRLKREEIRARLLGADRGAARLDELTATAVTRLPYRALKDFTPA
jgi:hypothetical protein